MVLKSVVGVAKVALKCSGPVVAIIMGPVVFIGALHSITVQVPGIVILSVITIMVMMIIGIAVSICVIVWVISVVFAGDVVIVVHIHSTIIGVRFISLALVEEFIHHHHSALQLSFSCVVDGLNFFHPAIKVGDFTDAGAFIDMQSFDLIDKSFGHVVYESFVSSEWCSVPFKIML
jgi:hypothetical protein